MQNVFENYSLINHNSFKIDVKAKFFVEISTLSELLFFLKTEQYKNISKLIIGQASNILFTKDFDGLIIKSAIKGITKIKEDCNHVFLKVGAGEDWDEFVDFTVNNKYAGLENLSLIPGTVGASPVQNIGAYGVEVKDFIFKVEAVNLENLEFTEFSNIECEFDYRNSIFKSKFKGKYMITSVVFCLSKIPDFKLEYGDVKTELSKLGELSLENVRKAIITIREKKLPDPKIIGNAGSFFKNPVVSNIKAQDLLKENQGLPVYNYTESLKKISAAWLIDSCGWKGVVKGNVAVHDKQALVIINKGNAKGLEVIRLSEEIKESVKKQFDVDLETEVNIY